MYPLNRHGFYLRAGGREKKTNEKHGKKKEKKKHWLSHNKKQKVERSRNAGRHVAPSPPVFLTI